MSAACNNFLKGGLRISCIFLYLLSHTKRWRNPIMTPRLDVTTHRVIEPTLGTFKSSPDLEYESLHVAEL